MEAKDRPKSDNEGGGRAGGGVAAREGIGDEDLEESRAAEGATGPGDGLIDSRAGWSGGSRL